MTETRTGRGRRGALPDEDDALDALSALANTALPPTARPATTALPAAAAPAAAFPAGPPQATGAAAAASLPAVQPAAAPDPSAAAVPGQLRLPAASEDEQADDGTRNFIKQSTIYVDADVKVRFKAFQDSERPSPPNADVIFQALLAAEGRYQQIVDARKPQAPEGQRWGRPVPGRRPAGTRLASQINFRPTVGEEADIKQLAGECGAASVSAFLNAVLDDFLPPAATRRTARA